MDKPDFSLFYYTYSTIAQTIAAVFGLLGAATLFRLQNLFKALQDAHQASIQDAHTEKEVATRKFMSLQRDDYLTQLEEMRAKLAWATNWTVGTIIACFILIPITSQITPIQAGWIPLVLTVGASIYTLTTHRPLVNDFRPQAKSGEKQV